jgi:hypothetical protein
MKKKTGVKVGDAVRFMMGPNPVNGTVKEDRGPIGHKGRRLYLIHFSFEAPLVMQTELPAEDLEVVRDEASTNGKS